MSDPRVGRERPRSEETGHGAMKTFLRGFTKPLLLGALIPGGCIALKLTVRNDIPFVLFGAPGLLVAWVVAATLPRVEEPPWRYLVDATALFAYWVVNTVLWAMVVSTIRAAIARLRRATRSPAIAGALLGAAFHLATVGAALLATGGVGATQGFIVAVVDYPLLALFELLPGGESMLYNSVHAYVGWFLVAGTGMYATLGALLGYTIA